MAKVPVRPLAIAPRPHDRAMAENGIEHLRVLIANERHDRLALVAEVVSGLGHEVIAGSIDVEETGALLTHPKVRALFEKEVETYSKKFKGFESVRPTAWCMAR